MRARSDTAAAGAAPLNARSAKAVPLSREASAEQIVDLCATTSDLVAFKAALRWLAPTDWPAARSHLEQTLGAAVVAPDDPASLAGQREARGRLAARFHKLQLLRAEDTRRRADDLAERRVVLAAAAETGS